MKALLLTFGSFVLTSGVVLNAYYLKKQFYPSVVYITKSNPSLAILYLQAFVFVVLMGKLFRKVFFGQLRAAEMEHLIERSWYAVTETCLAFTVFRDDFSPRFVGLFTLLLFLKCFHWLGDDRVDYMERSPLISWLFHLRALSLIFVLGLADVYFIHHAYYSTLIKGASVQLVFGFEYAILLTMVATILIKYVLHSVDLQSENPWENKAVYLLYTELILGFVRMVLYVLFLVIMTKVHTFPLFAIRPMYLTMRAFKKALNDVIMSRRAIRNMNTLYPDATPEELASGDNVCIICREDMVTNSKKLPCNHIFHAACLRSWFQRQQTCPTCRMDVLRPAPRPQPAPEQRPPAPEQPPQPEMFQGFPGAFPMFMPPQQPPQPPASQAAGSQDPGTSTTTTTTAAGGSAPAFPATASGFPPMPGSPFMMPPFMMPMPPAMPVPPDDGFLQGLSEEELKAMEGNERSALEARVKHLRDIQTLLDAAVLQMHQYCTLFPANRNIGSRGQEEPSSANTQSQMAQDSAASQPSTLEPTDLTLPKPSQPSTVKADTASEENKNTDLSELGAAGYTPPTEVVPEWHDDRLEPSDEDDDSIQSLRKRRLQKFTHSPQSEERTVKDNLELD